MATTIRVSRTRRLAAKQRAGASSVAPVASGYGRSLRPSIARFSRPASTTYTDGDC